MAGILTIYYSRKGENYWSGGMRRLEKGNTEIAAEFIRKAVGGDLFEVETEKPYSEDYRTCAAEANRELQANARPELKKYPDSLDQYETLFVGFPNWCGTAPMAIFTFLEHYDLTGRKIIPFCTHEGSGMGRSVQDLKKICRGASVEPGLAVRGSETSESENKIAEWAKNSLQ